MSEWWLSRGDGKTEGPLSTHALIQGLAAGQIPKLAYVCRVGEQSWVRVSQIDEIWEAVNPEQIRTNITERPWFLSQPDSGHHRLVDADADDEHTQVLTPLPVVTPGSGRPFATPLPKPATHRELLARQVVPSHSVSRVLSDGSQSGSSTQEAAEGPPIRAKVPTLTGISDVPPARAASHSQPQAPLPTALGATSGLKPFGVSPLAAIASLPNATSSSSATTNRIVGIGALKGQPTPVDVDALGADRTFRLASEAGNSTANQRDHVPEAPKNLAQIPALPVHAPASVMSTQGAAVRESAPAVPRARPSLPTQQASGNQVLTSAPPKASLPPQQPRFPAPPHAQVASGPAPSLTRPRPLNFGASAPPQQAHSETQQTHSENASSAASDEAPRDGVAPPSPYANPETKTDVCELELELTEDEESTRIASHPLHATAQIEVDAAAEEDELTTIARVPAPTSSALAPAKLKEQPPPATLPQRLAPQNTASSATADEDERTAIVPITHLAGSDRQEVRQTEFGGAARAWNGGATSAGPSSAAGKTSTSGLEPSVKPPLHRSSSTEARTAANALSAESLVSDPADLLEEFDDESVPPAPPIAMVAVARPSSAASKPAKVAPPGLAISVPSSPPPARRPRLPSAPSIVLKTEPLVHQEATQPAARALRRAGSSQLRLGTLVTVVLAATLVALAAAFFFMKFK